VLRVGVIHEILRLRDIPLGQWLALLELIFGDISVAREARERLEHRVLRIVFDTPFQTHFAHPTRAYGVTQ
jgi:hypothetical protein